MRVIFIFVFVLGLFTDGLFIRVNAPVMPSLSMSFEGFKLSTRHQPFMKGLRAHSEGISFLRLGRLLWPSHFRGQVWSSWTT